MAALEHEGGILLPSLSLALFAGLRPAEISRLPWDNIDLKARTVTITGKGAKLRARRVVELSDNAVEWLLACQRKSIKQARKSWDRLRVNCGYKLADWQSDTLRHTALSNHLAAHQNEGKTANWAGNSPNVLHKHHKGLIQVDNALAYWLVTPSNVDEQPVPKAA